MTATSFDFTEWARATVVDPTASQECLALAWGHGQILAYTPTHGDASRSVATTGRNLLAKLRERGFRL